MLVKNIGTVREVYTSNALYEQYGKKQHNECQVCLNQNENVCSINNVDQIIYPNSMKRDLSNMTIEQLFNMLRGEKPKTASTKEVGPVKKKVKKRLKVKRKKRLKKKLKACL